MNLKRILSLLITASFAFAATACANNTAANNPTNAPDASVATEATAEETTEAKIAPDLPDKDFGGYEFRVMTRTLNNPDWVEWDSQEIYAEEQNGEPINDAVFARNRYVEEKYNCKIVEKRTEYLDGMFNKVLKATVQSGDNAFDLVSPRTVDSRAYILDGYFQDLYTIPHVDLSKPWWNQQAVNELTIDGRMYIGYSDLLLMDKNAIYAILFNKDMLKDYSLEDPYLIVKEGKWTLGKMQEMMKGIARDLNSDGVMDFTDQYGLVGQLGTMTSMFHGSGERFAKKGADGYPEFTFGSQRSIDVTQKIFDILFDQTNTINAHHYEGKLPIYDASNAMFAEKRALFYSMRMIIVGRLRGMETDFGILPMPKFDEDQKDYAHEVCVHVSCCLAVPKGSPDLERTGIILEALTAESKYTIQPAYYDIALNGKYARDNESKEMLDIIFSTTVYDLGQIFDFGKFAGSYMELARKNNTNITSLYDKNIDKINEDIGKVNNLLAEIAN